MKRALIVLAAALALAAAPQPCYGAARRAREKALRKRSENLERKFKHYYEKENAEFGGKLKELASWCAEKGLNEEASEIWRRAQAMDPEIEGDAPSSADAAPTEDDITECARKKKALLDEHARELFKLGGKCYKTGLIGRAYDMVWEVVQFDTDHEKARKFLGQVKYRGEWRTIYDALQLRRGKVFTEDYGWIPKKYREKYEQGLLPFQRRWLPAEKVEEIRSSWAHAWKYSTEHFAIQTNVGLADAVAFGKVVEDNYEVFFRVFIGYFSPKSQTEMLFGAQRLKQRMKINYFATKEEYAGSVRNAGGSAGMYIGRARTSNFFKMHSKSDIRILKHETTHQMFAETKKKSLPIGCGAWVVEATATYMETCYRKDGKIVTEGKEAPWVKHFIPMLKADQAVPLGLFDQVTYEGFQMLGPIAYPQAASLALFFMEAEDGRYRERFVDYIAAHYSGRLINSGALAEYIGAPLQHLEREFHLFFLGEEGLADLEKLKAGESKIPERPQENEPQEDEKEKPGEGGEPSR